MIRPQLAAVRPVLSGHIIREGSAVIDASSSVTLIEVGEERILVDTGSREDEDRLLKALHRLGTEPGSVGYVINTHMHSDHCGCNDLFGGARIVAHALESPPLGSLRIVARQGLLPGVEIVPTPGHSEGSVSVFVAAEKRYAICGDAIPTRDNWNKWVPPLINIDRKLALGSMELIRSWADVIIPGHDVPILVGRKK